MPSIARIVALAAALTPVALGGAQAEISGGKIKIGLLTDMSGTYANLAGPGAVEAAKMAIEDMGGEVVGVPIELVVADHRNKAEVGAAQARQWADAEEVDVFAELITSSVALAVSEVGAQKNKLVIVTGAATSDLTGVACRPTTLHYVYDTRALAAGAAAALVKEGGDSWYFLTANYAFGEALERDVTRVVQANGGKVLGTSKHPFPAPDFSSYVLQAQLSGAKVVGLANAGADTINAIRAANDFRLGTSGQTVAGLLVFISDIHALGLDAAKGLKLTTGFYWDRDDASRTWSKRFFERTKKMPTMVQAGLYSALTQYFKAVAAVASDDAAAVLQKMREAPINDFFARNGVLRQDGRMAHDMLLAEVKQPAESKGPWDYYKILRVIPQDEAYGRAEDSACPLLNK